MVFLLRKFLKKEKEKKTAQNQGFYEENLYFKLLHCNYEQYIFCLTIINYYNEIYNHITKLCLIANNSVL